MKIYNNGELIANTKVSDRSTILASESTGIKTVADLEAFASTEKVMRFSDENEMYDFYMNILDASEVDA